MKNQIQVNSKLGVGYNSVCKG
jgi:hypothetical protein